VKLNDALSAAEVIWHRMEKFDPDGDFVMIWKEAAFPWGY
jgi:hypothetical protein